MKNSPLYNFLLKLFLFCLCILSVSTCVTSVKTTNYAGTSFRTIQERIRYYMDSRLFRPGLWSVSALYIDTDEIIADINSNKGLATGSNMKILTSAAALSILGPEYRYYTNFFYDGEITCGILKGNLYIRGSGDPVFLSGVVPSANTLKDITTQLINKFAELGIGRIAGSVISDSLLFTGSSIQEDVTWHSVGTDYGTETSALCINENMTEFHFKANEDEVKFVSVSLPVPYANVINSLKPVNRYSQFYYHIEGSPFSHSIKIYGDIPCDGQIYTIKAAVPDPALLVACTFTNAIEQTGIAVEGPPSKLNTEKKYNNKNMLLSIQSPPLKEIVYFLLKKSINLYAEQLCITSGLYKNRNATTESGIQAILAFLKTSIHSTEGIAIYDGSGLSRFTKISTRNIVTLLKYMTTTDVFQEFYNAFGIAGDPDDISFFTSWGQGTDMAFNARIKSGSIKWVKAHSGYVHDRNGRLIAFSMIANNYNGSPYDVEEVHREIIGMLAELE